MLLKLTIYGIYSALLEKEQATNCDPSFVRQNSLRMSDQRKEELNDEHLTLSIYNTYNTFMTDNQSEINILESHNDNYSPTNQVGTIFCDTDQISQHFKTAIQSRYEQGGNIPDEIETCSLENDSKTHSNLVSSRTEEKTSHVRTLASDKELIDLDHKSSFNVSLFVILARSIECSINSIFSSLLLAAFLLRLLGYHLPEAGR
jgi:hypothetical protein